MRAGTHLAFAGLVGVLLHGFGSPLTPDSAAALAAGSLLPDLDSGSSRLGRLARPVSGWLEGRFGHRTLTHSLAGLALLGGLAAPLLPLAPVAWGWLLAGAASHLLLDTVNVSGVPLLWPSRLRFWLMADRAHRLPTGSPGEAGLAAVFVLAALALLPVAGGGFGPAYHRLIGTPSGAVEDYLAWREDHEVFASVRGLNLATGERVEGEFRVVDAVDKEGLLLEDAAGAALLAGRTQGAVLEVERVEVRRGRPVVAATHRLDLAGRSLGDLLAGLPPTGRAWVTADLLLASSVRVPPPEVGRSARLRLRDVEGRRLEVRAATPQELSPYAAAHVERGGAVVRTEREPGEPAAEVTLAPPSTPPVRLLEVPDLPTAAALLVRPGDRIKAGHLIARRPDPSAALDAARTKEAAHAVAAAEAELARLPARHARRVAAAHADLAAAREAVARLELLVGVGAEPRLALETARAALRRAELERGELRASQTAERARLGETLDGARLRLSSARAAEGLTFERRSVRSPIAGLVSSVRVKAVSARGVTLEIALLEEAPR